MAIGDIYQTTTFYDNDGEEAQNVFHYVQSAGTGPTSANNMAVGWYDLLWIEIQRAMASLCFLRKIETVNLMDTVDFQVISSIDEPGLVTVSGSSQGATFDAWSIRFERDFPGAPTGHKRFPGVAETITSRNLYVPPQIVIDDVLFAVRSPVVNSPNADTFLPVIVKRPFSFAVPPTVWYPVQFVTWTNLTTQNSRKQVTI